MRRLVRRTVWLCSTTPACVYLGFSASRDLGFSATRGLGFSGFSDTRELGFSDTPASKHTS